MSRFLVVVFAAGTMCVAGLTSRVHAAEELRWDAPALLARSATSDVRLSDGGTALILESGVLFEDDGPAAGYSYLPNEEKLLPGIRIRKELLIRDPRARAATLLIGSGGNLQAVINGQRVPLKTLGKAGSHWETFAIPVHCLRSGSNRFELFGTGKVWIARDEDYPAGSRSRNAHPNRSAKSRDDGATWDDRQLGSEDMDGEYYVRLFLNQYRRTGTVTLPVLDVGNLHERTVAPPLAKLGPLHIQAGIDVGPSDRIMLRARSGRTVTPNEQTWTDWQNFGTATVKLDKLAGRFVQIAAVLTTNDALVTPKLKQIVIESEAQLAHDWTDKLRVIESRNSEIVRTTIPFEYELFGHPRLATLRRDSNLDDVVAGAKTEFELIVRLATWSAKQWDGKGHLSQSYPAWNALDILKPHSDGRPTGGFCQQFNLVFLQACASFGLVGRAVSLGPGDHGLKIRGGHEVVEIWSNEFQKWVYVDGEMAWYFVDDATSTPLSLRELRERQLKFVGQVSNVPATERHVGNVPHATRLVRVGETRRDWQNLGDWPPFAELRLIPRSNFLSERSPLPLNQGMRGWFWTGHFVWTDDSSPASMLYGNRVNHHRHWDWTLNQAKFILQATENPGVLRVHLDSETPGFEAFVAEIDETGTRPVDSGFDWTLHSGTNRLTVRPRNRAGREGCASSIKLEFRPH